jgi:hypothetical protein
MASSTRVHTLGDLRPVDAAESTAGSTPKIAEGGNSTAGQGTEPGTRDKFKLPNPQPAPVKVAEPEEDLNTFMRKHRKKNKTNEKKINDHVKKLSDWDARQLYEGMKDEVDELAKNTGVTIFHGQNFESADQAADEWVQRMGDVIQIDTEPRLRREAYDCKWIICTVSRSEHLQWQI